MMTDNATALDIVRFVGPLLCTIFGIMSLMALCQRRYGAFVRWSIMGAVFGAVPLFLPSSVKTSKPSSPDVASPATGSSPSGIQHMPWELVGFVVVILAILGLVILGIVFIFPHVKRKTDSKSENIRAWKELVKRHDDVRNQWASYEMDMSKLIDMPVMTDMREPVIIALHKALKTASSVAPKSQTGFAYTPIGDSAFLTAVSDLEIAFQSAEQTAKKVAWSRFSKEERRSLSTAKQLLSLATDAGASPAERQAAYKRLFKELQGLIAVPEKARLEIESRHQLSLAA